MSLTSKMEKNQTIQKAGLVSAGTLIIGVGVIQIDKNPVVGIVLVLIGVGCYVLRELIKLR